jgi:hypothetical protein
VCSETGFVKRICGLLRGVNCMPAITIVKVVVAVVVVVVRVDDVDVG